MLPSVLYVTFLSMDLSPNKGIPALRVNTEATVCKSFTSKFLSLQEIVSKTAKVLGLYLLDFMSGNTATISI